MKNCSRNYQRHLRHRRHLVRGTSNRPRLVVFRSHRYIYCQLVDDEKGHTLCSASSHKLESKTDKLVIAAQVGKMIAKQMKVKNINHIFFDRNGYLYHGRVKSLAEAVRHQQIKF